VPRRRLLFGKTVVGCYFVFESARPSFFTSYPFSSSVAKCLLHLFFTFSPPIDFMSCVFVQVFFGVAPGLAGSWPGWLLAWLAPGLAGSWPGWRMRANRLAWCLRFAPFAALYTLRARSLDSALLEDNCTSKF
jgi:hypothetical protein